MFDNPTDSPVGRVCSYVATECEFTGHGKQVCQPGFVDRGSVFTMKCSHPNVPRLVVDDFAAFISAH